ncbi:MAG: phospholipid carrier-dependent glycosyltransferase [Anaerolineales bacterium]
MQKDQIPFWAGLISLAVLGVIAVAVVTRWGVGLFDLDSFNYLASARSLAVGNGLQVPVSPTSLRPMLYFAPLLPAVLSVFELAGVDAMDGARWFNAALFGVNLLLFSAIAYGFSRSKVIALAAAFLFLFSADLLVAHSWALSEPLLITFMLASLLAFHIWVKRREFVWVLVLWVCVALAVLTKFVAGALVPVFVLLFWSTNLSRRDKLVYSMGTLLSGLIPFLFWSLRSYLLSASFHGFSFGYVPLGRGNLISAFLHSLRGLFPKAGYSGAKRYFLFWPFCGPPARGFIW